MLSHRLFHLSFVVHKYLPDEELLQNSYEHRTFQIRSSLYSCRGFLQEFVLDIGPFFCLGGCLIGLALMNPFLRDISHVIQKAYKFRISETGTLIAEDEYEEPFATRQNAIPSCMNDFPPPHS
jgi:hypothetical protein